MGKDDDSTPAIKQEMIEMDEVGEKEKEDGKIEIKQEMVEVKEEPESSSSSSGSSSDASSEVIFEDNGDYIETNLISAEDLKLYREHVAEEEGRKGKSIDKALTTMELAKLIYKRRKTKEAATTVEEQNKQLEGLKDKAKTLKSLRTTLKTMKKKKDSRKDDKKSKRKKSESSDSSSSEDERRKSRKRKSERKRSRDRERSRRSRSHDRSRDRKRSRDRSRDRSRSRRDDRKSSRRHRSRSRSSRRRRSRRDSGGYFRSHYSSKVNYMMDHSMGKEEYVKKCKSIQNGPDLPDAAPLERRRRRRSSSSGDERLALEGGTRLLAIEGPEMSKALITLYPDATPAMPSMPVLDKMRLPKQLAQQLFPVSCGAEHKTEESEKVASAILAIEGAPEEKPEGEEGEEKEEEKIKKLVSPSLINGIVKAVCTQQCMLLKSVA
eukprot:sb/3464830/